MSTLKAYWRQARPWLLALYILGITAALLYYNVELTIELVTAILFGGALLTQRGLLFLRDWGAFVAVLFAWQLTSHLAQTAGFQWHIEELINADRFMLGGNVAPLWLQQHLYHRGVLEPWDILAAIIYMLHFFLPLLAAFVLWMVNRPLFHRFTAAFGLAAIAGFISNILYPAVPPWMAALPLAHRGNSYVQSVHGHVYLPGVRDLFHIIGSHWYNPYGGTFGFGFLHGSYDIVGCIPSEHAMYPMLVYLFMRRQFGRWADFGLLYLAGLVFSITYLGQHYIIDALYGFAFAIATYQLVMYAAPAIALALPSRFAYVMGVGQPPSPTVTESVGVDAQ